jgi:hypothetical protein
VHAAVVLDLSRSQVHRLLEAYDRDGAAGLVSKRRGQPSNRRHSEELRPVTVDLVRTSTSPAAGANALENSFKSTAPIAGGLRKEGQMRPSRLHRRCKWQTSAPSVRCFGEQLRLLTGDPSRLAEADRIPVDLARPQAHGVYSKVFNNLANFCHRGKPASPLR